MTTERFHVHTIFSSLSTQILLNTNEHTDYHTLQVVHGGISVFFLQESKIAIEFLQDIDKIADHCIDQSDDKADIEYARKMIALCRKFCNVHG